MDLFWLFEGKGFSWLFREEILALAGFIEKTVNTIAIFIITLCYGNRLFWHFLFVMTGHVSCKPNDQLLSSSQHLIYIYIYVYIYTYILTCIQCLIQMAAISPASLTRCRIWPSRLRRGRCRSPGTGWRRSMRWRSGWPAWPCGWLPVPTSSASSPADRPWRSPDMHTEWLSYLENKVAPVYNAGKLYIGCVRSCPFALDTDLAADWLRMWWG